MIPFTILKVIIELTPNLTCIRTYDSKSKEFLGISRKIYKSQNLIFTQSTNSLNIVIDQSPPNLTGWCMFFLGSRSGSCFFPVGIFFEMSRVSSKPPEMTVNFF